MLAVVITAPANAVRNKKPRTANPGHRHNYLRADVKNCVPLCQRRNRHQDIKGPAHFPVIDVNFQRKFTPLHLTDVIFDPKSAFVTFRTSFSNGNWDQVSSPTAISNRNSRGRAYTCQKTTRNRHRKASGRRFQIENDVRQPLQRQFPIAFNVVPSSGRRNAGLSSRGTRYPFP